MRKILLVCILLSVQLLVVYGQGNGSISGRVIEKESKKPIEFVTVYLKNKGIVTETNEKGKFSLVCPAGESVTLVATRIGYQELAQKIAALESGANKEVVIQLSNKDSELEVIVTDSKIETVNMIREEVGELKKLPTTSGNFESVLPHIALGTTVGTGGELSSQYNVRGGNYDENLVYVNDFEIFRPQLIRNSQQEGLSFPNIDLIRDLSFSSGGFEAKYGDKMSSVLDIRYKLPTKFRASASMSFLGASAHIEGSKDVGNNNYSKFRYLIGARYKTSRYLLGSLDVSGQYVPNFTDIQGYFTYDITRDLQLGVIGNYNRSRFEFVPRTRGTTIGLINFAIRLNTEFTGTELDAFTNGMTGVSLTYIPDKEKNPIFLKLLASNYLSDEIETFDIIGRYDLSQIETDFGSDDAGQTVATLGAGTQHQFARNKLNNRVTNIQHKGGIEFQMDTENIDKTKSHFIQWSAKYQNEFFDDRLNEWERLDSAGYSLPFNEEGVEIATVLKTENQIESSRMTAYIQDTYNLRVDGEKEIKTSLGVRATFWDYTQELLFSPRFQFLYKPLNTDNDIAFKLAGGVYYQQPFYRELRRPDGTLNNDIKAQRSIHVLGGVTYDFNWHKLSNRPFKLISELYYKKLDNLITYEIDNVNIRYAAENNATGYVAGLDLRLNGEFVPGAESWVNLSLLNARENITDVQHLDFMVGDTIPTEVTYAPRPSDQFFTLSLFFQDYLPRRENFKMHMNLIYGSGLPFGIRGNNEVFRNVYRYRQYQRIDIGFALQLWDDLWRDKKPDSVFSFATNAWLSLEVFNLIGIENVASNTWIKTIFNQQYAVPNNLTSRRINLRMRIDF